MVLWWLGNLVLAAVIIPVVLMLLNKPLKPIVQIGQEADAVLAGGNAVAAQLELLEALVSTEQSVKKIRAGVAAYGVALDKLL